MDAPEAMIPPSDPTKLHAWFKAHPGSEQIASPFALVALAWWVQREAWRHRGRPRFTIADIGSGIGTTLACLAWWAGHAEIVSAEIISVEHDLWCQEQARQHLGHLGMTLDAALGILYYDKLPAYMGFDFLVLDGPQIRSSDWRCLVRGATVFVEGGRREQRKELAHALRAAGRPFCWATWKPTDRSKGFSVYRVEPTVWERLWFAAVRLRECWRDLWARLHGVTVGKRRP